MSTLARHVALEIALAEAKANVREIGGWNAGPRVEMYQREDTLPGIRYAWCQSFQNATWRVATGGRIVGNDIIGGQMLLGGTASVGLAVQAARAKGYIVKRPLRGDHFALQLGSDSWPDHVGQIVRVLGFGPLGYLCRTVEGNTGSGSIAEGDGVYVRTRWLSHRTIFYRMPGKATVTASLVNRGARLRKMSGYAAWAAWYTGTGLWKGYGRRNPKVRPDVRQRIAKGWWARLRAAKRK